METALPGNQTSRQGTAGLHTACKASGCSGWLQEAALGATSCPAMVPGAAPWPPLEPCTTAAGPTTEAGGAQGPGSSSPSIPEPASWARSTRVWSLVRASLKHPKNHQLFRFPSWKIGWARTKRRVVAAPDPAAGPSSEQNRVPRLLALDCEMCETEAEQHCLLGLSLVDQQGAVLYKGRHDSSEDAGVALRLVLQELAAPQRSAPLRPPEVQVDKAQLCKLLVHGYPAGTTRHQLLALPAQQRPPRKQGQGPPRAAKVDPQAMNGKRKRKAAALAAA
ncbi:exonuclease domain-containing protein [Haematococcus lacustris]|uniref:Exonuclease domain-containing protein n=1 Tax=Haematococcus lacustris TaxID=44745 RepID=A0A699ZRG1_HAELA|nr:exonuclease domain-containing protein [Haematococcus lacustris]